MRRAVYCRPVAVGLIAALAVSCATTNLPPISASGSGFKPLPDETALWEKSRDEEKQLREKVRLYDDPLLDSYLEQVVGRLTPPGMAPEPTAEMRGQDPGRRGREFRLHGGEESHGLGPRERGREERQ